MQMPRQTSNIQHHKDSRIPNVFWRSVSTDTLRANERYVALPPVSLLASTDGAINHRYVRQESPLWTELHDGMLTTGRLKQALGMHEAKAAQAVGIHPGSRGSSHLLSAYFHLLTTQAAAAAAAAAASTTVTSNSHTNPTSQSAAAANEAARQQFNQQLAAAAAADDLSNLPAWMAGKSRYSSIAELQQLCQHVAVAGDIPVKMYWGKVQEAAALYCLLLLFPESVLEEVGLFELELKALPTAWDALSLAQEDLPRLGASPDGLLVHKVTFTSRQLQAAAAAAAAALQPSQAADSMAGPISQQRQQQQSRSSFHATSQEGSSSTQQVVQSLLRQVFDAVPCTGTRPPVGVPTEDTSSCSSSSSTSGDAVDQEHGNSADSAVSVPAAAPAAADATATTSSRSSSPNSLAFQLDKQLILQELDAATAAPAVAGGIAATAAHSCPAEQKSQPEGLGFQPVGDLVVQLLQQYQQASYDGSSSDSQKYSMFVREVVEVKNHCPFAFLAKRKGKKGRVNVSYSMRARGPAQRVHPQWVPQLQMHMLATGCESALLVSRCAATGVRVFRMWRDDGYLQHMLQLLKVLQTEYVLLKVQPKPDLYSSVPGYRAFLNRTASIARSAVCIAAAGDDVVSQMPAASDGSNVTKFW